MLPISLASIEQTFLLAASLVTEFDGLHLCFRLYLLLFLFFVVCHLLSLRILNKRSWFNNLSAYDGDYGRKLWQLSKINGLK